MNFLNEYEVIEYYECSSLIIPLYFAAEMWLLFEQAYQIFF